MGRKRDDRSRDDVPGPFNNPFAALKDRRAELPEGPTTPAPVYAPPSVPSRAVVRYERKGRGGREATVVEQLGLDAKTLSAWLKELKRTLGCGGAVEGDTLVFQGDQRERLEPLLRERGVARVSVG